MQPHGNLTASYLWQPGELARRMLGERPSPVPPTRDLWPPPQPLSISTLHVAYLQDEPQRRASTLPPRQYAPTPVEHRPGPRLCTVGTNTDPPPTILNRLRTLVRRPREDTPIGHPPPGRLTAVPRETEVNDEVTENPARRAISTIKKALTGAKYRIAPNSDSVESPKIVYDIPKPGDRMVATFGARDSKRWCRMPSRADLARRWRAAGGCFERPRRPRPSRRQPQPPTLQITQVWRFCPGDAVEDLDWHRKFLYLNYCDWSRIVCVCKSLLSIRYSDVIPTI